MIDNPSGLSFEPYEADGSPRLCVGSFREPWPDVRRQFDQDFTSEGRELVKVYQWETYWDPYGNWIKTLLAQWRDGVYDRPLYLVGKRD